MNDEMEAAKAELRRLAHRKRAALHSSIGAEAAKAAARHFHDAVALGPDELVAGYWPIRDELDCRPVLSRLMDDGQPVCLPVVLGEDAPLEMRLWQQGAALYPSGFGTLAPDEGAPRVVPDVILMPLLGFDRFGTRLGYGGGYYDRTLAALATRPRLVGYAFAGQEIDRIPAAPHDVPLDAVVTEAGVTLFAREASLT